jgi:hypothetical protein
MVTAMGALLRWIAIITCAFVALGFVAFAVDEIDRGSKNQQNALDRELNAGDGSSIGDPSPTPGQERLREREHGTVREAIDDVNDVLLAPFASLIESDNAWVEHGVPTLLALLLYGVLLGTLANMLPRQRAHGKDWRAA